MNNNGSGKDDRALIRVIKFSSATGLGTMAAILYSVKQVTPVLRYEISFGTGLSFLLAVVLSWAYWRLLFGRRNDPNETSVGVAPARSARFSNSGLVASRR